MTYCLQPSRDNPLKEDCSTTRMWDQPLPLVTSSKDDGPDPRSYVTTCLKDTTLSHRTRQSVQHATQCAALSDASHSLQQPYIGPYNVMEQSSKSIHLTSMDGVTLSQWTISSLHFLTVKLITLYPLPSLSPSHSTTHFIYPFILLIQDDDARSAQFVS